MDIKKIKYIDDVDSAIEYLFAQIPPSDTLKKRWNMQKLHMKISLEKAESRI
jgi:hypothetical protein